MPIFDYKCPECECIAEDVLVNYAEDEIICEDCNKTMSKLPSTFCIQMGNVWVKSIENKYGRDGNPYRDEEGKPRPGTYDGYPIAPGPKTKARWKRATKEISKLKEREK